MLQPRPVRFRQTPPGRRAEGTSEWRRRSTGRVLGPVEGIADRGALVAKLCCCARCLVVPSNSRSTVVLLRVAPGSPVDSGGAAGAAPRSVTPPGCARAHHCLDPVRDGGRLPGVAHRPGRRTSADQLARGLRCRHRGLVRRRPVVQPDRRRRPQPSPVRAHRVDHGGGHRARRLGLGPPGTTDHLARACDDRRLAARGSRLAARGSGGGRRVSVVRDEAADSQRGRDDG